MLGGFQHIHVGGKVGDGKSGQTALPSAEEIAGATQPQVGFGDLEAVVGGAQGLQPLPGGFGFGLMHEETIALALSAAHPAAQLVQLAQTEKVGVLHDHQGGPRHVHTHLDDGGGHQYIQITGGKGPHDGLFFGRLQLAVHQSDTQPGQNLLQLVDVGGGSLFVAALFPFFHQRTDDIGLPSGVNFFLQKAVHILPFGLGNHPGHHRLTARGQLVQHRNVQIAVENQRQRPGDGSGRHGQQMPPVGFLVEGGTLGNAEAVLLVHHDEGGVGNLHIILNQRMGAAQNQRLAALCPGQHPPFFGGRHGGDQQLHRNVQIAQKLFHGGFVLTGQQLGGRHHDGLLAVLDGQPGAGSSHQRFARAHVALQQPVHAAAAAQIGKGLPHRPPLGVGGRKGQRPEEVFGIVILQRRAGILPSLPPQGLTGAAKDKQLFKNQPPPGFLDILGILGVMDGLKGLLRRAKLPFCHNIGRQRLQIPTLCHFQRCFCPLSQLILAEFGGSAIDGQQFSGGFGIVGRFKHRVDHAPSAAGELRLAEEDIFPAPLDF